MWSQREPQTGSATLTIESVTNVDSGNYVCVASNDGGQVEETAQIIGNCVEFFSSSELKALVSLSDSPSACL